MEIVSEEDINGAIESGVLLPTFFVNGISF